jgi:hypothetical protein
MSLDKAIAALVEKSVAEAVELKNSDIERLDEQNKTIQDILRLIVNCGCSENLINELFADNARSIVRGNSSRNEIMNGLEWAYYELKGGDLKKDFPEKFTLL